jgi:hypothetical protein
MRALLSWLAEPVDSDQHFDSKQPPQGRTHDPLLRSEVRDPPGHSKFKFEPKFHPKTAENAP